MEKKIQDLITIHLVANGVCETCGEKEDAFYDYMCDAHTHGMTEFGHNELQLVLLPDTKILGYIINSVAERILSGDIIPKDKLRVSGIFEDCDIRLDKVKDQDGNFLWRIIIPDDEGKFPEETDDKVIARQLHSPYIEVI